MSQHSSADDPSATLTAVMMQHSRRRAWQDEYIVSTLVYTSGSTTPRRCPARGSYAASSSRLPKGVYEIPLRQINDKKAYGMDVDVGTSPQKVTLLVDTGSNTYSVQSSYDICCQEAMCKDTASTPRMARPWKRCTKSASSFTRELVSLDREMWRQLSLCCFNDMSTMLLVHGGRMLGIIGQELTDLVARGAITQAATALDRASRIPFCPPPSAAATPRRVRRRAA
ncbi:hypothetical protein LMH87_000312 [Akanthomyces muscarius]|uniref:Peptidase A1 domain-containing protein n=1 Tax=Akanthomyces muscarius TaxID=2231603 RepID=A0A9W8UNP4_AKAMU|nr:hypothetical protein LMH87_000312 [Akanthomyces muscarius]KAJ4155046.1 hypothetical protein LMH87_000312 [Akanthomyces muscarius]